MSRLKNIFNTVFLQHSTKTSLERSHFVTEKDSVQWSGDYKSWCEAEKVSDGYSSSTILKRCKASLLKVKNGEAIYERDSVLFDEVQYSWPLLAGLEMVALENEVKLCVLDFGGSLGSTYYQNIHFLKKIKKLEWCIIEQDNFVKCGKENFENDQLKFYKSIDDCLSKHVPHVILLSSVLQYLEHPISWIEKFIDCGACYIIIDRTSITNFERDILTIQKVPEEIYQASYPCWFFNKENLLNAFKRYTTIASFKSFCDNPIILNFKHKGTWEGFILKACS